MNTLNSNLHLYTYISKLLEIVIENRWVVRKDLSVETINLHYCSQSFSQCPTNQLNIHYKRVHVRVVVKKWRGNISYIRSIHFLAATNDD